MCLCKDALCIVMFEKWLKTKHFTDYVRHYLNSVYYKIFIQ